MVEATIGGFVLFALGVVLALVAHSLLRGAMLDPEIKQRQTDIVEATAQANAIKKKVAEIQNNIAETVEELDRVRVQLKAQESRLSRVTRNFRVVVEHGQPSPKNKRYDGSVFNRNANAMYSAVGGTAIPSFFAHEVQIVIWAESLNEARGLLEKTYTAKDGYNSVFHGEIFGAKG
jgi:septal ring factor EnvC (AmiA/AmiB activator)